ncbi:hypothetical protein [Micromonospora sp. SH-82]|uniref:hypothetical protein n=1 Tax=Micromonospora sp. SH-82 TaxID=3132938 RepID=UPI003EBFFD4B
MADIGRTLDRIGRDIDTLVEQATRSPHPDARQVLVTVHHRLRRLCRQLNAALDPARGRPEAER